jgi:rubrerythrin
MEDVADLIKHAIENEVRAMAFYVSASELASEGESQMVFLELIDMEKGHADLLVDRFGAFLAEHGVDAAAHLAGLRASVERVLNDKEKALLEEAEMGPVVDFAIQMEEAARDNYFILAERFSDAELIDISRDLAAEEQKHFDMLSNLRSSMDTPPEERPGL